MEMRGGMRKRHSGGGVDKGGTGMRKQDWGQGNDTAGVVYKGGETSGTGKRHSKGQHIGTPLDSPGTMCEEVFFCLFLLLSPFCILHYFYIRLIPCLPFHLCEGRKFDVYTLII